MAKYEIKDGVVVVKYHITEDLVNTRIPFLRAYSRLKPSEGITAVYVDGQTKKIPPKSSITFNEVGEHIAKIVLENAEVDGWAKVKTDAVEGYVMLSFLQPVN